MMRCVLLLLALLPTTAAAQSESFIIRMGADTIAVETFVRTGDRLEGQLSGAALPVGVHYVYQADSIKIEVTRPGSPAEARSFPVPAGNVPFINLAFSLVETALARAHPGSNVAFFIPDNGVTMNAQVEWLGTDSAVLKLGGIDLRVHLDARRRILHATVPSQNVTVERVAGTLDRSGDVPDYSAPAGARYSAENVVVKSKEGHTLAGTLTLPLQRAGKIPAVITISGSGAQERDEAIPGMRGYRPFRQLAEALAERGVAVLRYDDRGFGQSTGVYSSSTSADFANDTRAVLDYLRGRPEIDAERIFLVGHSEGAMIAPMVAAQDERLRGIVLLAGPAHTGRRIIEYQNRNAADQMTGRTPAERDSLYRIAVASLDSVAADQPWFRYFLSYDPLPFVRQVEQPVLIVHGATDRQVTAEQAEILASTLRSAGNDKVAVHVLPGVNHLFLADPVGNVSGYSALPSRTLVPELVRIVTDWIANTSR